MIKVDRRLITYPSSKLIPIFFLIAVLVDLVAERINCTLLATFFSAIIWGRSKADYKHIVTPRLLVEGKEVAEHLLVRFIYDHHSFFLIALS